MIKNFVKEKQGDYKQPKMAVSNKLKHEKANLIPSSLKKSDSSHNLITASDKLANSGKNF